VITDDEPESPNRLRAILQISGLVVSAAIVLWLIKGGGASQVQSLLSPPTPRLTSAATSRLASDPACRSDQLALIGALNGRASPTVETPPGCPLLVGDSLDVVVIVRDSHHKYRVFMAVDGGYRGPGPYLLAPWPHDYLGAHDGAAKVALREDATGSSWQSSAGSLTVGPGARSGTLLAALDFAGGGPTPTVSRLKLDGSWSC
jgi:hypothetical protein